MNFVWFEQIIEYLYSGGPAVMGSLTVAVFVLWYALGYRMLILRRGSPRSVRSLIDRYRRKKQKAPIGIIDTAVELGLRIAEENPVRLRKQLDQAFFPLQDEIARYAVLVRSIVAVSPLLGLLGTVIGMIETFDSLGDMSLFSQSGGIAGGISQALFTTQMGLAVALPGLLAGRILDRRQTLFEAELAKIKDILCSRG